MLLSKQKYWAGLCSVLLLSVVSAGGAFAQIAKPEGDEYSVNDFGGIGLMQARTARFAPDGELNIGASFLNPYRRYFITWQILPQVEVTFRYTDPTNTVHSTGRAFDQSDSEFFSNLINFRNGDTQLDRGFGIKIKLKDEGKYMPALAVGLQDFVGTGLFAGEYLVATKAIGRFDVTLGIAWGKAGNRGNISNPFKIFGGSFSDRNQGSGLGGGLKIKNYFSGDRAAIFGGIEYFSEIPGLSIKMEYGGSDPEKDRDFKAGFEHLRESFPINIGVNYRVAPWFDAAIGYERGNSIMIRGSFRANLNRPGVTKTPVPVARILQREEIEEIERTNQPLANDYMDSSERGFSVLDFERQDTRSNQSAVAEIEALFDKFSENEGELKWVSLEEGELRAHTTDHDNVYVNEEAVSINTDNETPVTISSGEFIDDNNELEKELFAVIQRDLQSKGFWGYGLKIEDSTVTIFLSRTRYTQFPKNVGLVARAINNHLPSYIERITVVELVAGFEIARISVMRSDIEREARYMSSAGEIWFNAEIGVPQSELPSPDADAVEESTYPNKIWWITPELKQHLGDPTEGIYLADLDLEAGFAYSPMPGLTLSVVGRRFIAGSLDNITRGAGSVLPHVRTDLVKYLQGGKTSIKSMQADYIGSFKPNWYYRIAVGLFESMYGGVGTEVLYRPYGKPWALSVELDWAKKRDFDQLFTFRDYNIVTGHATLNYDMSAYGLRTTVSAGRYLAGDYGMTFEISRRFDNGVRVGAFFTRTNVSAADFGEGSFDKGFYIKFPFDAFLKRDSKQEANFLFRPLTRDGGQKLGIGPSLFELVDRANYGVINKQWSTIGR